MANKRVAKKPKYKVGQVVVMHVNEQAARIAEILYWELHATFAYRLIGLNGTVSEKSVRRLTKRERG